MGKTKTAVWQQWDNIGLEYLNFTEEGTTFFAESTIITIENNLPFLLRYDMRLDKHFQVERVVIRLSGRSSCLLSHRAGQWFDHNKHNISELEGCYDIDISATPFTNTLPIRRLEWQPGQSRSLDMLYIRVPEMTMERARQQYTCLEKNEHGSIFEYRQADFSAILPIDADGFVQNYPNLFRRLS